MGGKFLGPDVTDLVFPIYGSFDMDAGASTGRVALVGAGPGDSDLITVRGERALADADVILYDSLVDAKLLEERTARLIYVGKRCGQHSMSQEQITSLLIECARSGARVVRLKGGDPSVFGRVGEEAQALARAQVHFEIIPGVSSAVAAPALAGIPVTHRGLADGFTTVTAHKRKEDEALGIPPYRAQTTLVLLMPLSTLERWHNQLLESGYPPDLPLAFISQGCSARTVVFETTVGGAPSVRNMPKIVSPSMVVVGNVVGLRRQILPWLSVPSVSANSIGQKSDTYVANLAKDTCR